MAAHLCKHHLGTFCSGMHTQSSTEKKISRVWFESGLAALLLKAPDPSLLSLSPVTNVWESCSVLTFLKVCRSLSSTVVSIISGPNPLSSGTGWMRGRVGNKDPGSTG